MSIVNPPLTISGVFLPDLLFDVVKPTVVLKSQMGAVAADTAADSMIVFQGKLYIGTGNSTAATDSTGAKLLVFDGTSWSTITKATMGAVAADRAVESMAVYGNKLYVGWYNTTVATDATASKVCVFNGSSWSVITKATMGAVANDLYLVSMGVYNNALYIGTGNTTAATDATGAKVLKYDGATWSIFTKATMGGIANDLYMQAMAVYNDKLYIGTTNATAATDSTGAKVLTYNGSAWAAITKATMGGAAADLALQSMAVYNGKLYIGTANITAATDATAAKLIVFNGNGWATIIKSAMGGLTTDQGWEDMAVYDGKLYVGGTNPTAAVDGTANCLYQFDQMNWARIFKTTLGNIAADTDIFNLVNYHGMLYMVTWNSTAAVDATAWKMTYLGYPIAENFNSYCPRGF